jgi:hypothetical protein
MTTTIKPPRLFRAVETMSLFVCFGFEIVLAHRVGLGIAYHPIGAISAIALVVLGYLAADFISGFVHFIGDSFGTVDMPVLGSTFILPFRSHHDLPNKIRTHDVVETNGNNCFVALFVLIPTVLFVPVREGHAALGFGLFVLVLTSLVSITNQIHKWAHTQKPPRFVRFLQRSGIILSPRRHGPHHRAPHRQGYCITVGIFNDVLDRIGFFPRVERMIRTALRLERARS